LFSFQIKIIKTLVSFLKFIYKHKSDLRQTINKTNIKVMLLKKIVGTIIILLNIAGLGFLLYMAGLMLKEKFFHKKQIIVVQKSPVRKKNPKILNDNIIPDEDDLLKDMDLSDLDNLDLDDFE